MPASLHRPGSPTAQSRGILWLIGCLGLVKFLLPFLLQHPVYEPHRDEFLYLAEGRHLAWGYPGSPPLTALFAAVTNWLGAGFFWIKFWPALFGAFTYVLVARAILLLGGGRFALVTGFLPFVSGGLLQTGFLFEPTFLGSFFQALMAYEILRFMRTRRVGGLYWAGIGFGLGMLSQYMTLLFALGLVAAVALSKERRMLLNPHFHCSLVTGVLLLLPNLLWQANHGWPAIDGTLDGLRPGMILLELPVIVIGALWLERVTRKGWRGWRYGLVGFGTLAGCLVDSVSLPVLPPTRLAAFYAEHPIFRRLGFLRWEDGHDHALPKEFADMLGWEEIALKVAKAYDGLDSAGKAEVVAIGGNGHGESGALDYYGPKYSLPPVTGRGVDYLMWTPAGYYDRDVFIYTTDDRDWVNAVARKKFAYAAIVDSVTHPYAGEYGSYILVLKGPNSEVRQEWKNSYRAAHRTQLAAR